MDKEKSITEHSSSTDINELGAIKSIQLEFKKELKVHKNTQLKVSKN